MAHFARIDETNTVVDVLVVADADAPTEAAGRTFLEGLTGKTGWLKTSYNTKSGQHPNGEPFRGNYAGIGYTYDAGLDVFFPPKPFPSWHGTAQGTWEAPTPKPEGDYVWDEGAQEWKLFP